MSGKSPLPTRDPLIYEGVNVIVPVGGWRLVKSNRAPTSNDKKYPVGSIWVDSSTGDSYILSSNPGNWFLFSSSSVGSVNELTGDSGGAILPVAGNIDILGDSVDGVSVVGTAGTLTVNVAAASATQRGTLETSTDAESVTGTSAVVAVTPASLTARLAAPGAIGGTTPGAGTFTSVTATTSGVLVSGGDIVNSHSSAAADVTIEVTNSDNTSGSSRSGVEIATGGASSGDPYLSFQISGVAASTMTMGLDNSASDLFVISNDAAIGTSNALTLSQAGALTATTSITATLGDVTATNGNLVFGTAGNKIMSTSVGASATAGANSFGTVTLVNGTVVVSTTAVTASSIIMLTRQSVGATGANDLGILSVGAIVAATSFVIDAWTVTNATALQADDQSVIGWMIIN